MVLHRSSHLLAICKLLQPDKSVKTLLHFPFEATISVLGAAGSGQMRADLRHTAVRGPQVASGLSRLSKQKSTSSSSSFLKLLCTNHIYRTHPKT